MNTEYENLRLEKLQKEGSDIIRERRRLMNKAFSYLARLQTVSAEFDELCRRFLSEKTEMRARLENCSEKHKSRIDRKFS